MVGHLGILLTVLALVSGVIALTYTINLYQKIRIRYLKFHNIVFAIFNYEIFVGMAFNYFQFNIRAELTAAAAQIIPRLYHFHFSVTTLLFLYGFILILYELQGKEWTKKWRIILLAVYSSLIILQLIFSLFPLSLGSILFYILILLMVFLSSHLLTIILIIRVLFQTYTDEKGMKSKALKAFGYILLSVFVMVLILNILQGFNYMSTELYVLLLSICVFFLNMLPIKYMKGFIKKVFPDYRNSQVTDEDRQRLMAKYKISRREAEIIQLICLGKSNKDIEDELYISIQTVKDHIYNIYKKTGVKNRVQLTNLFR
jgi:DNA-binding NarL/FixJ family response regulator